MILKWRFLDFNLLKNKHFQFYSKKFCSIVIPNLQNKIKNLQLNTFNVTNVLCIIAIFIKIVTKFFHNDIF